MLLDVLSALFLTHVVHAANVKTNQRRFAPTLPHIAGITGPLHRNTHDSIPDIVETIGKAVTTQAQQSLIREASSRMPSVRCAFCNLA